MRETETRVYLITGTRKGLGQQLAEHYLAQGHTVVGCSRQPGGIEHPNYEHYCLDVADEAGVMHMVRQVKQVHGRVDVLLNNAGMAAMNHFLTTPYAQAQAVMQSNFWGTFLCSREVAKVMMRQTSGVIVNYTTVAVALDLAGEAVYAASKAAIESLTRVSAKELAQFGIRVNAVGPTPMQTDLIAQVPSDKIDALLAQQAIQACATPADIINVIDFFTSPDSGMITGQTLYLGGVMQ